MFVIEYDVYVYEIQGDITTVCLCSCDYSTPLSVCVCVCVCGCVCNTCDLVQALSGDMIVLIDPFPVTLEVDLGGGGRPAPQLDRPVLYDESVLRFQQEFWERFCRRWREGVGENLGLAVVAALWKHMDTSDEGDDQFNGNTTVSLLLCGSS